MARPLVDTKFFAPRSHRALVSRARLEERLQRGAHAKLILISAPAGFGKTTLLAAWVETNTSAGKATAWLSLEPTDNDVTTFWTYVAASLQALAESRAGHDSGARPGDVKLRLEQWTCQHGIDPSAVNGSNR